MRRFTVLVLLLGTFGLLGLGSLWETRGTAVASTSFIVGSPVSGTPPATAEQPSTNTPTVTSSPVAPTNTPTVTTVPTNTPSATVAPTTTTCAGGAFFDDQTGTTPTPCLATPVTTATTVSPTATSVPMGAPARIVDRATLRHEGKTVLVRWHLAFGLGIKGFQIYADHRLLTRAVIRPHRNANYTVRVEWISGRLYRLAVLFRNGRSQIVPIR